MRLHTLLAAATLIIVLTVPTGCWDRREIETLAFINTAAIDRPADGEGIRISVQIVKPFVFGAEEPGELQERAFWLTGAEGRTVGEASASLREHSPRVPFWAHNLHLVLGEDFARGGGGGDHRILHP